MSIAEQTNRAVATRGGAVESSELMVRQEQSRELAPAAAEVSARAEMEGAIIVAKKFPRSEDKAFAALMKSCSRPTFAEDVCYQFPRGGEQIKGPSVYLARECARVWGNLRYGMDIVSDDENERHIRGWAWDVETNTKVTADDSFAKLVYRKKGGWQKPDERDLRELTNRRAAIVIRNCILCLMPSDLVEDAVNRATLTLQNGAEANPDDAKKKLILAFQSINVTVEDLESYLTHKIDRIGPAELAGLRQIYKSIADGNSRWDEYAKSDAKTTVTGPVKGSDLSNPKGNAEAPRDQVKQPENAETVKPVESQSEISTLYASYLDSLSACTTEAACREAFKEFFGKDSKHTWTEAENGQSGKDRNKRIAEIANSK